MVVMLMYMTKLYIYIYITQLLTKLVNKGPSRAYFQNRVIATIGKSS